MNILPNVTLFRGCKVSKKIAVIVVLLVGWGGVGWVAGATLRLRLYVHIREIIATVTLSLR